MPTLGSHPNVYNACLEALEQHGFTVSVTNLRKDNHFVGFWHAEKNGFYFTAENPIELLGLCAIYILKGEPNTDDEAWWGDKNREDRFAKLMQYKTP